MPNNYAMDFNDDLGSDHGSSDTTDFENIFDSPNLRPSTASTSPFPTLTPESSFEKSPGPDFSPLMGDHRNYFCDTSGDILCPATATLLQDDNSLNLDSRWAPNEVAAESYGQVQPAGSCPAGIEDWKMADCDPFAQVTLTLEDVQPEILSTILNRIINTKTKIKVEHFEFGLGSIAVGIGHQHCIPDQGVGVSVTRMKHSRVRISALRYDDTRILVLVGVVVVGNGE
ncbi:hypothetical protein MMC20_005380 [Loxospora ochrophaea]|nr:hypothetical protein [Loxospora ochrophaea]